LCLPGQHIEGSSLSFTISQSIHDRFCEVSPIAPYSIIIANWERYAQASVADKHVYDSILEPWRLCYEEAYGDAVEAFTAKIAQGDLLQDHFIVRRATAYWSLRDSTNIRSELPSLHRIATERQESMVLEAAAWLIVAI